MSDDSASFEAVMEECWAPVFRLCHRILGTADDAEEAAQQAFFQAFKAWGSFAGRSKPLTWLYRIAVNVCRRRIRLKARYRTVSPESMPEAVSEDAPRAEDEHADLHAAMAQLKPAHRTILTLFYLDELSHQEIADILGCPEGTMWSRLYHAKKALEDTIRRARRRTS